MDGALEQAVRAWRTVEADIAEIAPALLSRLPPAATPEAIQRAERELGVTLPASVVAVYLVHDGIGMLAVVDRISEVSYLLTLDDVIDQWRELTQLLEAGRFRDATVDYVDGPVRGIWWSRKWIPISTDGAGNHHCIDLDPAEGGTPGQIIGFWHDDNERNVVAPDLSSYLLDEVDVVEWAYAEGIEPRI